MDEAYKIVKSSPEEFGDVGTLTEEEQANLAGAYDTIQQEELEKAFPNIEFVVVNPGQVFQAQRHNADLEEGDNIADFIGNHSPEWIEKALEQIKI